MKFNHFLIGLILFLSTLSFTESFGQGPCSVVNDPYYAGLCEIGINRFLGRAVYTQSLSQYNNDDPCYGSNPTDPQEPSSFNCTPPYNECWGKCPAIYLKVINDAVKFKATMLVRAASIYGKEQYFNPQYLTGINSENGGYYQIKHLVEDVNHAFDCENLPRPVIQGEIIESMLMDAPETAYDIPDSVINAFLDEMSETEKNYYSTPHPFTKTRMLEDDGDNHWHTFSKIESRMWFYYAARQMIDLGCTSIHMGIYPYYAKNATNGYDPGYQKLYSLCSKIRDYAKSFEPDKLILLTGETGIEPSAKLGGTEKLIFDFDSRAMRPHEIESANSGDFECNDIIPIEGTVFNEAPCDNEQFPAVIDPCIISQIGQSVGGDAPLGCHYEKVPYYIHWDFGNGVIGGLNSNGCFELDPLVDMASAPMGVYGYEDTRWFATKLSDECKAKWFEEMYCQFRDQIGPNGFMQVPLLLPIGYPELYDNANCIGDELLGGSGAWVMSDNNSIFSELQSFMDPNSNPLQLNQETICHQMGDECSIRCNDLIAPHHYKYIVSIAEYKFSANDPDCSSTYSWHIYDQSNQSWLPITIGSSMTFNPPHEGMYRVYLRRDNIGLDSYSTNYGTQQRHVDVGYYCCHELVRLDGDCVPRSVDSGNDNAYASEISEEQNFPLIGKKGSFIITNQVGQIIQIGELDDHSTVDETIEQSYNLEPGLYFISIINANGQLVNRHKVVMD